MRPASLETATAAEVLGGYLHTRAADFLRSLRLHSESVGSADAAAAASTAGAVRRLRGAARRLSGTLHTYRPLVDTAWADQLCAELRWLSGTLADEYGHAARLDLLLGALHRLASDGGDGPDGPEEPGDPGGPGAPVGAAGTGGAAGSRGGGRAADERTAPLPAGAARAGALLERQLTLARTRAHTAALQALVSARFHAVADAVAVLAYEAPLVPRLAEGPALAALVPLAEQARQRLAEAAGVLPLSGADALARTLTSQDSRLRQDAAWHQVRLLLRLHRYAEEVLLPAPRPEEPARGNGPGNEAGSVDEGGGQRLLRSASAALDRHRDAAEAAAAAAAAARTPRIAPATAYALGVLHADQRHEVEAARADFGGLWGPYAAPGKAS